LEAIVSYCDQIGALPILIVPPANEARYEPNRSTLPTWVSTVERQRLTSEFERARAGGSRDPEASAALYESILSRHPGFAEAHFRLAELLERQGRFQDAADHYLRALDEDGLPIRCPAPLRAAYVEVARRHPRAILIDGRQELRELSPNGLLGDEMIQDTHHPTFRGYLTLAGAVLRELAGRKCIEGLSTIDLPLDGRECARHFGMGPDPWATACDRTSTHYHRVAGYRYDPAARLRQSWRYAEAARQIRAGIPIDEIAVTGIALKSPGSPR
jgi:tetratricopeptide (TPR) repeat protein